jgi:hypothetical protein
MPHLCGSEELDSKRFGFPLSGEQETPFPSPDFPSYLEPIIRERKGKLVPNQTDFVKEKKL